MNADRLVCEALRSAVETSSCLVGGVDNSRSWGSRFAMGVVAIEGTNSSHEEMFRSAGRSSIGFKLVVPRCDSS